MPTEITPLIQVFSNKLPVAHLVNNIFRIILKPSGSLPWSQKPVTWSCLELNELGSHPLLISSSLSSSLSLLKSTNIEVPTYAISPATWNFAPLRPKYSPEKNSYMRYSSFLSFTACLLYLVSSISEQKCLTLKPAKPNRCLIRLSDQETASTRATWRNYPTQISDIEQNTKDHCT